MIALTENPVPEPTAERRTASPHDGSGRMPELRQQVPAAPPLATAGSSGGGDVGRSEHPTITLLDKRVLEAMGAEWTENYYRVRRDTILKEQENPLLYGYEIPKWTLADEYLARFRARFPDGVAIELDLGGNRASKSERRAKRLVQNMVQHPGWRAWACQSTQTASRQNQQSIIYKYLPNEWKPTSGKLRSGVTTKIVYTQAGGFTEDVLVCPNGSECRFKFYSMSVGSLEGAELDEAWADELVPTDWIEALIFRLVTRNGLLGITFTPIEGYSATVKAHLNGAVTMLEAEAELLPVLAPRSASKKEEFRIKNLSGGGESRHANMVESSEKSLDSGSSAPPAQNNLPVPVLAESSKHNTKEVDGGEARESTGREPLNSGNSRGGQNNSGEQGRRAASPRDRSGWKPEPRDGMEVIGYEKVPVIQENLNVVIEGQRAKALIVYFHTSDNPYGNYASMKATLEGASREKILTRAYGVPTKAALSRFPLWDDLVHIVSLNRFREIQRAGGTWYMFLDPCSGRNWFALWVFIDVTGRIFVRAEMPSHGHADAYIPGVGDPGPWAVPSNKLDGSAGDGQKEWGWGYGNYLEEIERVERLLALRGEGGGAVDTGRMPVATESGCKPELREKSAERIQVYERWIDARYGNARLVREEAPTTTIEDLEKLGMRFLAAPSEKSIDSGRGGGDGSLRMINDALFYDKERAQREGGINHTNQPRLYVCESCPNTIYALKEWTGQDGQHGACKDPIDCLRMLVLSDVKHVDEKAMRPIVPWVARRR